MQTYKYVDQEHADAFAAGSVRIGTFASYSQLESQRRDNLDGKDWRAIDYVDTGPKISDEHRYALRRLGFYVAEGGVKNSAIRNLSVVLESPPFFIFCSSIHPTPSITNGNSQVLFRIKHVRSFGTLLQKAHSDRLGEQRGGRVRYRDKIVHWSDKANLSDVFIKDVAFRAEDEFRLCWYPKVSGTTAFNTPPNSEIAALVERL